MRQLEVEFAPLAREKGLDLTSCRARSRCAPTGGCCGGCCRTSSRTRSNTRRRAACWSAAGARRRRLRIDVYDTGLGIPQSKQRAIFKEFHRLDQGAQGGARPRPRPLDRRAHRARARPRDRAALDDPAAARISRVEVPLAPAAAAATPRARRRSVDAGQLAGTRRALHRQRADDSRRHGDAARRLGLPRAQGGRISTARSPRSTRAPTAPNGLLVDYHLDGGNGIEAIAALRRRFGADLPAILITADRSPRVREEARARDIQVLNKPLKPAALRALIAQWRVQRVAAAE